MDECGCGDGGTAKTTLNTTKPLESVLRLPKGLPGSGWCRILLSVPKHPLVYLDFIDSCGRTLFAHRKMVTLNVLP